MISNKTVDNVRELPIHDVLSKYVQTKRQGANYVCCCPFHGEKTPSISISPIKNLWHCFGCGKGGDAISFVAELLQCDFQKAVEDIAAKNGVPVEHIEKKMTAEEVANRQERESLLLAIQQVQQIFIEEIGSKSSAAAIARQYAYNRWEKDFCDNAGIGFAPDEHTFLEEIEKAKIDKECLAKLGIISIRNGAYSPLLRDRITIPIFNRTNQVIGFTARAIGSDNIKYLNLPNSTLFNKSETVFGLNVAARSAQKNGFLILVEGAPDVLRLQSVGLENAVATLGTAWTEKHFQTIKKLTDNVCFIPDSDIPKGNSSLGAGFVAVMKNGAEAMRQGFNVTVRELPFREEKIDADAFIKTAEDFYQLEEKHFVVWMASKKFPLAKTLIKTRDTVAEIAELLKLITDKIIVDECIEQLTSIYGKQKFWRERISDPGKPTENISLAKKKSSEKPELKDLLKKFNLSIGQNMYWYSGGEEPVRLSNFILEPMYHIKDESNGTRIFRMVNEYNDREVVEFKEAELVSLSNFQQKVGSLGNYIWKAKIDKLNIVKELLYTITDSADLIKQMGWDPVNEFYAWGNGILKDGKFLPVDDLGIVSLDQHHKYYIPATSVMYKRNPAIYQFERMFIHENRSAITLYDFAQKVIDVFGDNGKVGLCFLIASLFRDIIYPIKNCFPILNLFGLKGTGKTSLATTLQSVFIHSVDPPSIGIASIPSMNDKVSQVTNAMVVFDEYKNDLDERKIAYLKALWGGAGQTKKNMSGDGKAAQTVVTSAVVLCGQDLPTRDIALYSRVIHLTFSRPSFTADERRRFDDLKEISNIGNTHLAIEILNHRKVMVQHYKANHSIVRKELSEAFKDEEIEDRVMDNWVVPLAAYRSLESSLRMPFSYTELFDITVAGIRYQNEGCKKNTEMAEFWEIIDSLHSQGKIIDKAHFRIKYVTEFKAIGKPEHIQFAQPTPILFINPSAVSALYSGRIAGGATGKNANNWNTVLTYLKVQPSFLGLKQDRFNILLPNGNLDFTYENINGSTQKKLRVNRPKALVFDYSILKQKYNINLETSTVVESEIDDEEAIERKGENIEKHNQPQECGLPF